MLSFLYKYNHYARITLIVLYYYVFESLGKRDDVLNDQLTTEYTTLFQVQALIEHIETL